MKEAGELPTVTRKGTSKYPWDTIMDGHIWEITKGDLDDWGVKSDTFDNLISGAYMAARQRGKKVHVRRQEDRAFIQAVDLK